MISKKERVTIKKIFGVNFSEKIAKKLLQKNVRNRNGYFFNPHSVTDVLNGQNHSVLEDEIREIWKEEVEEREQEKLVERSNQLIS